MGGVLRGRWAVMVVEMTAQHQSICQSSESKAEKAQECPGTIGIPSLLHGNARVSEEERERVGAGDQPSGRSTRGPSKKNHCLAL